MRKLIMAAGLALALSGAAQAQELSTTPMKNFTSENVSALLTKIGAQNVTASKDTDGLTSIVFEVSGSKYRGVLLVCKQTPNCLGLLLGVPVFLAEGTFSPEVVNSFNGSAPFGKAYRTTDGKAVILFRYVIADNGVLEGNVASNIANFSGMPEQFARHVASQTIASNQDPKGTTATLSTPKPATVAAKAIAPKAVGLKVPAPADHVDLKPYLDGFAKDTGYTIPK